MDLLPSRRPSLSEEERLRYAREGKPVVRPQRRAGAFTTVVSSPNCNCNRSKKAAAAASRNRVSPGGKQGTREQGMHIHTHTHTHTATHPRTHGHYSWPPTACLFPPTSSLLRWKLLNNRLLLPLGSTWPESHRIAASQRGTESTGTAAAEAAANWS